MSMDYIRRYYGVPAKRGGRVIFDGKPGVITGADGARLRVRLDGSQRPVPVHPTWRMEYLPTTPSPGDQTGATDGE